MSHTNGPHHSHSFSSVPCYPSAISRSPSGSSIREAAPSLPHPLDTSSSSFMSNFSSTSHSSTSLLSCQSSSSQVISSELQLAFRSSPSPSTRHVNKQSADAGTSHQINHNQWKHNTSFVISPTHHITCQPIQSSPTCNCVTSPCECLPLPPSVSIPAPLRQQSMPEFMLEPNITQSTQVTVSTRASPHHVDRALNVAPLQSPPLMFDLDIGASHRAPNNPDEAWEQATSGLAGFSISSRSSFSTTSLSPSSSSSSSSSTRSGPRTIPSSRTRSLVLPVANKMPLSPNKCATSDVTPYRNLFGKHDKQQQHAHLHLTSVRPLDINPQLSALYTHSRPSQSDSSLSCSTSTSSSSSISNSPASLLSQSLRTLGVRAHVQHNAISSQLPSRRLVDAPSDAPASTPLRTKSIGDALNIGSPREMSPISTMVHSINRFHAQNLAERARRRSSSRSPVEYTEEGIFQLSKVDSPTLTFDSDDKPVVPHIMLNDKPNDLVQEAHIEDQDGVFAMDM